MRGTYRASVIFVVVFIIAMLVFAWWASGEIYHPRPTKTVVWPTRVTATSWEVATVTPRPMVTATVIPSSTSTLTFTPTLIWTATQAPMATSTPILYAVVEDKETDCMTYFIRPWGIKMIPRCWLPQQQIIGFTPSPIYIP